MRSALLSLFRRSPFDGLKKHAELIRQSAPIFRMAVDAYVTGQTDEFEKFHNQITLIEDQGDHIKRNIRGHLPRGILLPMDKIQLLWYLREQDKVLDCTQDSLHWLSFRKTVIPEEMHEDLMLLVDKVANVLSSILHLVEAGERYFQTFTEQHRTVVKEAVREIRELEFHSDLVERKLLADILSFPFENATSAFHLTRLVEHMGDISNHAENAGDMMRAMIAR